MVAHHHPPRQSPTPERVPDAIAARTSDEPDGLFDTLPVPRVRPAPDAPGITVAHLGAATKPYVYVGRAMQGIPASPLGNPFRNNGAIGFFREWLRDAYKAVAGGVAILAQAEAVAELHRLTAIYRETGALTLACWCAPAPCHADEIARAIIGICEREPVELPGLGWAYWHRPTAEEGLPWVVLGADSTVVRAAASLTQARQPLSHQTPASAPRSGEYPLPVESSSEACRSCGAAVVWATTTNGRAIPLSVATIQWRDGQRWALAHFSDCPEGKDWRRR